MYTFRFWKVLFKFKFVIFFSFPCFHESFVARLKERDVVPIFELVLRLNIPRWLRTETILLKNQSATSLGNDIRFFISETLCRGLSGGELSWGKTLRLYTRQRSHPVGRTARPMRRTIRHWWYYCIMTWFVFTWFSFDLLKKWYTR